MKPNAKISSEKNNKNAMTVTRNKKTKSGIKRGVKHGKCSKTENQDALYTLTHISMFVLGREMQISFDLTK